MWVTVAVLVLEEPPEGYCDSGATINRGSGVGRRATYLEAEIGALLAPHETTSMVTATGYVEQTVANRSGMMLGWIPDYEFLDGEEDRLPVPVKGRVFQSDGLEGVPVIAATDLPNLDLLFDKVFTPDGDVENTLRYTREEWSKYSRWLAGEYCDCVVVACSAHV